MSRELFQVLAESRKAAGGYYNLFSRLFHREIDEEIWALLENNVNDLPDFSEEKSAASPLGEAFERYASEGREQGVLSLSRLYAKTFLGMREGGTVPLCQSVYTSPKHMLFQEAVFDARAIYRSERLELAEGGDLPDDHLAVILAFLGRQAALAAVLPQEAGLWAETLEKEALFRQKLVLNWVSSAATLAAEKLPGDFYSLLLRYLAQFVEYDHAESAALLADVKTLCEPRIMVAGA